MLEKQKFSFFQKQQTATSISAQCCTIAAIHMTILYFKRPEILGECDQCQYLSAVLYI